MATRCLAVFGTRLLYPSSPLPSVLEQVSTSAKVTILPRALPSLTSKRLLLLILVLSVLLVLFVLLAALIQITKGLHFLTGLYGNSTSSRRGISSQLTMQPKLGPIEDQADRDHRSTVDEITSIKGSL